MRKKRFLSLVLVLAMVMTLIIPIGSPVYAAEPSDENYDDDFGYTNTVAQFVIDDIKYTLIGSVTNTVVATGGSILSGDGSDYYISILADSVKIEAADGSYFKLNGFAMDAYRDSDITITPSSGASLTPGVPGGYLVENIDVSGNADFQNINSVTISGVNMILNIDDFDFSPTPTYTVTYNGNNNTGGVVPIDGNAYHIIDTVAVLGNTGTLERTGYTFAGWNTAANGSGTSYASGGTLTMDTSNVTFYAQWTRVPGSFIFFISDGNISIENAGGANLRVKYGAAQTTTENFVNTQEITIIGTTVTDRIYMQAVTANVTLENVDIQLNANSVCAFGVENGAAGNLILTLVGNNTLKSGNYKPGLEVAWNGQLTIKGTGALNATGGMYSAGIGSSLRSGIINILGGTINA